MPDLAFDGSVVKGERTPCLEGHAEDLFPALVAHNMTYDSLVHQDRHLLAEEVAAVQDLAVRAWRRSRSTAPASSRSPWITTSITPSAGLQRRRHPGAVRCRFRAGLATYNDMYNATFNGNRAPLVLGNHFNAWNNGAYEKALTDFVLEKCGQPET